MTLLPVSLPWGQHIIEQVMPQDIMQQFLLLREKATSHIMQRGILVEHPESDIDLLKRRLVDALELGPSKSGDVHYPYDDFDDADVFDSAISISGEDDVQHSIRKRHDSLYTNETGTWDIRIFAANGLMRADTWASAWNEMERVDVEIMPHIPLDIRSQLDIFKRDTDASFRQDEMEKKILELEKEIQHLQLQKRSKDVANVEVAKEASPDRKRISETQSKDRQPPAYRAKEVPLSILLHNYIYLLARDRHNIVIFGLSLLVLILSMQSRTSRGDLASTKDVQHGIEILHNEPLPQGQHSVGHMMSDPVYSMIYATATESVDASPTNGPASAGLSEDTAQSTTKAEIRWNVDSDEVAEMASD